MFLFTYVRVYAWYLLVYRCSCVSMMTSLLTDEPVQYGHTQRHTQVNRLNTYHYIRVQHAYRHLYPEHFISTIAASVSEH